MAILIDLKSGYSLTHGQFNELFVILLRKALIGSSWGFHSDWCHRLGSFGQNKIFLLIWIT